MSFDDAENGTGEVSADIRLTEANFQRFVELVIATRKDVVRHEETLHGGPRSVGLMRIGEETRSAMRAVQAQYLDDRDTFLKFWDAHWPKARRLAFALAGLALGGFVAGAASAFLVWLKLYAGR